MRRKENLMLNALALICLVTLARACFVSAVKVTTIQANLQSHNQQHLLTNTIHMRVDDQAHINIESHNDHTGDSESNDLSIEKKVSEILKRHHLNSKSHHLHGEDEDDEHNRHDPLDQLQVIIQGTSVHVFLKRSCFSSFNRACSSPLSQY